MYVPHDYTHARKRRRSCPRRPRWSRLRRPKRSRQKRGRCACYIITYRRAYTHMHRQCLSRVRRLPDAPVELTEAVFNPAPPLMSICPCSSLHAHVTFVEVGYAQESVIPGHTEPIDTQTYTHTSGWLHPHHRTQASIRTRLPPLIRPPVPLHHAKRLSCLPRVPLSRLYAHVHLNKLHSYVPRAHLCRSRC